MKYFVEETDADVEVAALKRVVHPEFGSSFRFTQLVGRMGGHGLLLLPVGVQFANSWHEMVDHVDQPKFQNRGVLPTIGTLCSVVDALEAFHGQHIIHRDIKLENMMLLHDSSHPQVCIRVPYHTPSRIHQISFIYHVRFKIQSLLQCVLFFRNFLCFLMILVLVI
jgi:hypothetical protein